MGSLPKGRFCNIRNYHASQLIYVRQGTTATTSAYDVVIAPGQEVNFSVRDGNQTLSLIASGASTTCVIGFGDFLV
jgi:hypothetical protein